MECTDDENDDRGSQHSLECKEPITPRGLKIIRRGTYTVIFLPEEKVWRAQEADGMTKFALDNEEKKCFLEEVKKPGVKVFYMPGKTATEEEFFGENGSEFKEGNRRKMFPRFSAAGDGAVEGPTRIQPRDGDRGPRINCNHHHGSRFGNKCTSKQYHAATVPGGIIDKGFRMDNDDRNVFYVMNHMDEDSIMSFFEIENMDIIHEVGEDGRRTPRSRMIQLLVDDIGAIDEEAGVSPLTKIETEEIKAIFLPMRQKEPISAEVFVEIYEALKSNILDAVERVLRGEERKHTPSEEGFRFLRMGKGFVVVSDVENEARNALKDLGVNAAILVKAARDNGMFDYTIQRIDLGNAFPLDCIFQDMNLLERVPPDLRKKPMKDLIQQIFIDQDIELLPENAGDHWNGDDVVGGSPRERGSWIGPDGIKIAVDFTISRLKEQKEHIEKDTQTGDVAEDEESGKTLLEGDDDEKKS